MFFPNQTQQELFIIIFHKKSTRTQELKPRLYKKKIVTFHFFWKNSRTLQLVLHVLPRFLNLKIEALIVGWVNKEKKRKEKTDYHLSLFHCWTWAQEQLSWSQDPNNMNTQNQDQNSRSQDLNSMTQTTWPIKLIPRSKPQ